MSNEQPAEITPDSMTSGQPSPTNIPPGAIPLTPELREGLLGWLGASGADNGDNRIMGNVPATAYTDEQVRALLTGRPIPGPAAPFQDVLTQGLASPGSAGGAPMPTQAPPVAAMPVQARAPAQAPQRPQRPAQAPQLTQQMSPLQALSTGVGWLAQVAGQTMMDGITLTIEVSSTNDGPVVNVSVYDMEGPQGEAQMIQAYERVHPAQIQQAVQQLIQAVGAYQQNLQAQAGVQGPPAGNGGWGGGY